MALLHPKKAYIERAWLTVTLADADAIERIMQTLIDRQRRIDSISIKDLNNNLVEVELAITLKRKKTAPELYLTLKQFPDIIGIKLRG